MSTGKHIDVICIIGALVAVLLLVVFINGEKLGITPESQSLQYESQLFDTTEVHSIDIVMDDWDEFIAGCEDKEYAECAVVIDGEAYKNVAIRAKGNNSLTSVSSYGNDRYSFKVEFDHYDDAKSYYGLDKLNLNSLIHDNTMMKDYLVYQMMRDEGVAAPLCSYAYITVNGEDWGLYLAVEGVEEAFLQRNFGKSYGELYKPDSLGNGGGRPEDNSNNADVKLQYIDDEPESYANIFENAKTDITEADKTRLVESLKRLADICGGSDGGSAGGSAGESELVEAGDIESVVDVEQVIKYFAVHNFVCNFDSYTGSMVHNYYLYENNGRLAMIPWDYNLAFGNFQGHSSAEALVNFPIDTPVSSGDIESLPMLAWIFADEEYTGLYHSSMAEFLADYFASGYFDQLVDGISELITPYVEKDPTKFCTFEEFSAGMEALREFCQLRAESVAGQLDGSIPATAEGQSADSSMLISADGLDMSAMGGMNGGAPGGKPGNMGDSDGKPGMPGEFGGRGGVSEMGEPPEMPEGEDGENPGNMADSGGKPGMPGDFGGRGGMSEMGEPPEMPEGENGENLGNMGNSGGKPGMPGEFGGRVGMGEMPGGFGGRGGMSEMGEPPEMPEGENGENPGNMVDSGEKPGMPGDFGGRGGVSEMGEPPEMPEGENGENLGNMVDSGGKPGMPGDFGGRGGMSEMPGKSPESGENSGVLLILSVAVLVVGLAVAYKYGRRKK